LGVIDLTLPIESEEIVRENNKKFKCATTYQQPIIN
jgi:hypothetical protein